MLPNPEIKIEGKTDRTEIDPHDENNLKQQWAVIFKIVFRRKWFILSLSLLLSGLTIGVSVMFPKRYVTTSYVTLVRSKIRVEMMEVEKVSDPGNSRDKALIALAMSGDVLNGIRARLPDFGYKVDNENFSVEALAKAMDTEFYGDLVGLEVRWNDPKEGATLANLWAEVLIKKANLTYAPNVRPDDKTVVDAELSRTSSLLNEANQKWLDFVNTDTTDRLSRKIGENKHRLDQLFQTRQTRVSQRADYLRESLSAAYKERLRMESFLIDAQSLANQMKAEGRSSAGSRLAMISLKSKLFGGSNLAQFHFDLSPLMTQPAAGHPSDLSEAQELVKVIKMRLGHAKDLIIKTEKELQQGIGSLALSGNEPIDEHIEKLLHEISSLQSNLARQENLRERLDDERKQLFGSFQASFSQQLKLSASNLVGDEIRLASPALPSSKAKSFRPFMNATIVFVYAFIFLIAWVFYKETGHLNFPPRGQRTNSA